MSLILSIDQGTTSTRAMVFDIDANIVAKAQVSIETKYPQSGWVEQDPLQIWQSVQDCICEVVAHEKVTTIACCGITNQRETTIIWDRNTGLPIYPAIVWQDRRTHAKCQTLGSVDVQSLTGLLMDPYFSATKIAWILDHVDGARLRAEKGELAFGTIDSFLLWHLTGGEHITDVSNAARTLLFNIHTLQWDRTLLDLFQIPDKLLPTVLPSCGSFGVIDPKHTDQAIPITAVAGDQQAALVGHAGVTPGTVKSTYGTGGFLMANTGVSPLKSKHKLLSTIAYQCGDVTHYGLEGSIFVAGAVVQWLRDNLGIIDKPMQSATLAAQVEDTGGVYFVPAFTGLGAPYWDPQARGAILGLNRNSGVAHIVRAALESVCYQTKDLLLAMQDDGVVIQRLRVDGGMVANEWLLQFLADIIGVPVDRAAINETTALGAALMAGTGHGIYSSLDNAASHWLADQSYEPKLSVDRREELYAAWQTAVHSVAIAK